MRRNHFHLLRAMAAALGLTLLCACAAGEAEPSPTPAPELTAEALLGVWHNQDRSPARNFHTFFYRDGTVKHLGGRRREMGTWALTEDGRVLADFERCYYGEAGALTRIEGGGYQCWYALGPDGATLFRECPEPLDGDRDDYGLPLVRVKEPVESAPSENATVFQVEVEPGRSILAQVTRFGVRDRTRVEVFQRDGVTPYIPAQTFELTHAAGGAADSKPDSWVELTDLDGDGRQDFAVRYEEDGAFRRVPFLWDPEKEQFVQGVDNYSLEREIREGGETYVLRFLGEGGPRLDRVEVYRKEHMEQPIQTFSGFIGDCDTRFDAEFIGSDLNFDGDWDFRLLASSGRVGDEYFCWLWDPETKRFQFRDTLSLVDPVFDLWTGLVYTTASSGLWGFSRGVYRWEEEELVPLYKIALDTDGEEMRNVFSAYQDGDWTELRRWSAPVGAAGDSRVLPGAGPYLALLTPPQAVEDPQPGEYEVWRLLDMGPGREPFAVRLASELTEDDFALRRVETYRPDDLTRPVQTFRIDDWTGAIFGCGPGEDCFFTVEDMNFDGWPDFRVMDAMGMVNAWYLCWLWDEETGRFERYKPLEEVCSPRFDQDQRIIESWARGSAVSGVTCFYTFENGELVLLREHNRHYPTENNIQVLAVRDRVDGELREVYHAEVMPGDLEFAGPKNEAFAQYGDIDYCTPAYGD